MFTDPITTPVKVISELSLLMDSNEFDHLCNDLISLNVGQLLVLKQLLEHGYESNHKIQLAKSIFTITKHSSLPAQAIIHGMIKANKGIEEDMKTDQEFWDKVYKNS